MIQRIKHPPKTPAERQRKCRAIKRGEQWYCKELPCDTPPHMTPPQFERLKRLSAPAAMLALPAPVTNAIQKTTSAPALPALPNKKANATGDAHQLALPPTAMAKLQSLLNRQDAGKSLTAAERSEAQALLDIAEFFVIQRLRQRLAA